MQLFLKKGVVFLFLLSYTMVNEGQQETPRTKGGNEMDILKSGIYKVNFGSGHDFVVVCGGSIEGYYPCKLVERGSQLEMIHESRLKFASEEATKMCIDYIKKNKEEF